MRNFTSGWGRSLLNAALWTLAATLVPVSVAIAQAPTPIPLFGTPSPGNLFFNVYYDGKVSVSQYDPTFALQRRTGGSFSIPEKGSAIAVGSNLCNIGLPSGRPASSFPVSNSIVSATDVETIVDCFAGNVRWEQLVSYPLAGPVVHYQWRITNNSGSDLSDVRFFHASNLQFGTLAVDTGVGQYDNVNQAVNSIGFDGTDSYVAVFKSLLPPFAFQADDRANTTANVFQNISNNQALNGNISPGDTSYGLEWRTSTLANGNSWVIEAFEQFSFNTPAVPVNISSPVLVRLASGATQTISFLVTNFSGSAVTIDSGDIFTFSPGWSASLTQGFPITLPNNSATYISADVTTPADAAIGDQDILKLGLHLGSATTSEFASLVVDLIPPPVVPPSVTSPRRSTRDIRPKITGKADANALVAIEIDGNKEGQTAADATGNWSYSVSRDLSFGPHQLMVVTFDSFRRRAALPSPLTFSITKGSQLDFDGDGTVDLTSYSASASRVAFRWTRSSDNTQVNTILPGRVPAPGDYNGDGVADFATIARSGDDLVWTVLSAGRNVTETFGKKGKSPLTGCAFKTPKQTSLALLSNNDRTVEAKDLGDPATITFTVPRGAIIGCADHDADGLDEIIIREEADDGKVRASLLSRTREVLETGIFPNFDRGFVTRGFNTSTAGLFTMVRLAGPALRKGLVVGYDDDSTITIDLPRKLVVSSGTFVDGSGIPRDGFFWQNLKTGEIFGQELVSGAAPLLFGKISIRSLLVQPSYIYRTTRK